MLNGLLDQYNLPEVAVEDLKRQNRRVQNLGDGVDVFMPEHDQGLAYRFYIHTEFNEAKSKAVKLQRDDEIEMIEWTIEKGFSIPERVRFLPPELLEFNEDHECIGGRYKESYLRWKEGRQSPGLPLSKWGVLADGDVSALARNGIFSVEQFAATPRSKLQGKYYEDVMIAHDRAIYYVKDKENNLDKEATANQIVALQQQIAKLQAEVSMKAEVKQRGRPKKTKVNEGEIIIEGDEE